MVQLLCAKRMTITPLAESERGLANSQWIRNCCHTALAVAFAIVMCMLIVVIKPAAKIGFLHVEQAASPVIPTIVGLTAPFVETWIKNRIDRQIKEGDE